MDKLDTTADSWHRSQLSRQLKRLVRAVAVLGYCRRNDAIDTVAESITEVEQTLNRLSTSPAKGLDDLCQFETSSSLEQQRVFIEAHTLLTQARSLINVRAEQRFNDLNVIEMRRNQADLADAAFERMLVASDVPSLYSSTLASENLCFVSNDSTKVNKNDSAASSATKNKRAASSLKLVVNNNHSKSPARPGKQK